MSYLPQELRAAEHHMGVLDLSETHGAQLVHGGGGRRETREGRREKGDGRREKGEGRTEKGERETGEP